MYLRALLDTSSIVITVEAWKKTKNVFFYRAQWKILTKQAVPGLTIVGQAGSKGLTMVGAIPL